MNLKRLEDYIALASAKNFSAAARLRNVTHPAFGRRINALDNARQTATRSDHSQIRICTGRTLARTMVADWITQIYIKIGKQSAAGFHIRTASLHEAALSLETDQSHFMIAYEHRTASATLVFLCVKQRHTKTTL
jgi:LysR family transcriptional regulator, hypochlorite-specific transcription factor HypT